MTSQEMIEIIEPADEFSFAENITIEDMSDIVEIEIPKSSDFIEQMFIWTGQRRCAQVTAEQIQELRKQGTHIFQQNFGNFWLLILQDDLMQMLAIIVNTSKGKPHYARIVCNSSFKVITCQYFQGM